MLVVDGVEEVVLEQPHEVRKLEGQHTLRRQQRRDTCNEVVQIRYLREHVVGDDEIRSTTIRNELCSNLTSEERDKRRNSTLDPKDWNVARDEVLEEITVIRGKLDHETLFRKVEAVRYELDVLPRVLDERVGIRREVGV